MSKEHRNEGDISTQGGTSFYQRLYMKLASRLAFVWDLSCPCEHNVCSLDYVMARWLLITTRDAGQRYRDRGPTTYATLRVPQSLNILTSNGCIRSAAPVAAGRIGCECRCFLVIRLAEITAKA